LGKCFKEGGDIVDILKKYESLRIKRARDIMIQSSMLGRIGQFKGKWTCAVRNAVIRNIPTNVRMIGQDKVFGYNV
jgi:hypothetical protein